MFVSSGGGNMRNTMLSFLLTLTPCFLTKAAAPPAPRRCHITSVLPTSSEILEEVFNETYHCSFLFVLDDNSYTIKMGQFMENCIQVLGPEGLGTAGAAVFQVAGNADGGVNLTHTFLLRVAAQGRRLRLLSWCMAVVVVSDNPAFLAAFAKASDSSRLMVWETRLLVITRLTVRPLKGLLQEYWTFSMMNTMFLMPKSQFGNERLQFYVHLPHTPAGPQVVRVANWIKGRGLVETEGHSVFPEKYNNFHGMSMKIAWFSMTPYLMEMNDLDYKNNRKSRYTGRDYEILETIAEALNFSINFLPVGRLDHVINHLAHRRVYIGPMKLAFIPHLLEVIDYTMFIERATLGFSMVKPTIKPSWQSLYYPLQPSVWGSIAASVLLVFSVLMLINRGPGSEHPGAWLVVKHVVGPLLDEAIPSELPRRSTTRLVLAAWLICTFILGTLYRSNLTASLTVPKYPPRAETLAELIDTRAKVSATSLVTDFINNFKESSSEMYRTLSERIEFVPTFQIGMKKAIEEQKAYLYERLNMKAMIAEHFTSKRGSTPLYVARENLVPDYCGWPLSPNAPFKANLDHYIMAFHGAGLIERWTTDVLARAQLNNQRRQSTASDANSATGEEQDAAATNSVSKALTLVHLQGPLFLFLAGGFFSVAVFFGENTISILCAAALLRHNVPVFFCPTLSQ